jgi:hypothetical protein
MEHSRSGLFALHITSLVPETPAVEPVGKYDPSEQLWRDEGSVVACDQSCLQECERYLPARTCITYCCCFGC